jgi:CelD/BcsL family acetyltransferase involved in cellulose biosynthesis
MRNELRLLRPDQMTARDLAAWSRLQEADPALASPFLRPEFAEAVGAVRDDVVVAAFGPEDSPQAFLGFQRRGRIGLPLGGGLSDCQAIVATPGWRCEGAALVRALGLARLDVTRMAVARGGVVPAHGRLSAAPLIRLGCGFEAYARARRAAGSQALVQAHSHARRLERALGPLRFVPHDPDPRLLHRLITWKRVQYARPRWGGALDPLARPWAVALLERVQATQTAGFAGMLCTLWAGDTLVAAHLGLRSRSLLHWWFPAHDPAHAKLAPGRILLLEAIRHAAQAGLAGIDLGAGEEGYKRRFADAEVTLVAGTVGPISLRRRAADAAADVARRVPAAAEWMFRREWHRLHR